MAVSERQLAEFADKHAWQIPFDTSPRHLAGPGDARHVTHGLAAVGWTRTSDPLSAEIVLRSPDGRHSLQFDPQSATSAWWRLRAEPTDTEAGWYAEFGELVPAEILSGVMDALVCPPRAEPPDPWRTLSSAGWTLDQPNGAHSPDGMCHIELRLLGDRDTPSWHIETREHGHGHPVGPRIWHAWFDHHTPSHLVSAFVTALTDTAPLQRGMFERTAHYSAAKEPSPLSPQQVVDAHTARLDALRTQARAARRRQRPATTQPLGPPPKAATPPVRR
ncbi:DUF317 domain-containing protein [Streptomyces ipomoeae]|uniref:DUF317 domain-containing protein n=1 Tax=Streptomyces ipomoeae TaxID=103232 RepID=UPI0029A1BB82|nr:DUF317 domain-containing protein [Streptomyces ipomoeae]MDX2828396.1 DUF317 domain-containing protein [Streptomyces ipomoeae]MDX2872700.1 DUF317 domain-containing protein [Streptomyces ipomoeae]